MELIKLHNPKNSWNKVYLLNTSLGQQDTDSDLSSISSDKSTTSTNSQYSNSTYIQDSEKTVSDDTKSVRLDYLNADKNTGQKFGFEELKNVNLGRDYEGSPVTVGNISIRSLMDISSAWNIGSRMNTVMRIGKIANGPEGRLDAHIQDQVVGLNERYKTLFGKMSLAWSGREGLDIHKLNIVSQKLRYIDVVKESIEKTVDQNKSIIDIYNRALGISGEDVEPLRGNLKSGFVKYAGTLQGSSLSLVQNTWDFTKGVAWKGVQFGFSAMDFLSRGLATKIYEYRQYHNSPELVRNLSELEEFLANVTKLKETYESQKQEILERMNGSYSVLINQEKALRELVMMKEPSMIQKFEDILTTEDENARVRKLKDWVRMLGKNFSKEDKELISKFIENVGSADAQIVRTIFDDAVLGKDKFNMDESEDIGVFFERLSELDKLRGCVVGKRIHLSQLGIVGYVMKFDRTNKAMLVKDSNSGHTFEVVMASGGKNLETFNVSYFNDKKDKLRKFVESNFDKPEFRKDTKFANKTKALEILDKVDSPRKLREFLVDVVIAKIGTLGMWQTYLVTGNLGNGLQISDIIETSFLRNVVSLFKSGFNLDEYKKKWVEDPKMLHQDLRRNPVSGSIKFLK